MQLNSFAQSGWTLLNPLPTVNNLKSIYFVDNNTGWMAGECIVLKTTDGGINWDSQMSGVKFDLCKVQFHDNNTGWIVGYDWSGGMWSPSEPIILKTTNGGSTWQNKLDSLSGVLYSLFFLNANIGWAVGYMADGNEWFGAILKTTDGGESWFSQSNGTLNYLASVFFIDHNTGWIAGEQGTILKTTDGGDTWNSQTSGTTIDLNSVCFIDNNIGWTIGHYSLGQGNYWSKVFKTTDGGTTWFPKLNTAGEFGSIFFIDTVNGWAAGYKIDGSQAYGAVIKTTDGGESWAVSNIGSYLNSIYMLDNNLGWAVGDGGKIFKTENSGDSWTALHRDFIKTDLNAVDFIDDSKGWIIGTSSSFYTYDGGESWTSMNLGSFGYPNAVDFVNDLVGWVVGRWSIWHTTDGGVSWITQSTYNGVSLNSVCFIDENNGWTVGNYGSTWEYALILHTSNGGLNWEEQYRIMDGALYSIDFVDNLKGWAVGGANHHSVVLFTNDGGVNWEQRYNSSEVVFKFIDFIDSLNGWATVSWPLEDMQLFKTTDGGFTWNGTLRSPYLGDVDFIDNLNGWVGGQTILRTRDGGINWIDQNIPAGSSHICMVDTNTGFAVDGLGIILKTTTGGVTSVRENINDLVLPNDYYLKQNYPNPFNPTTKIKFSIPETGITILKVYDIMGREVATLVNEEKTVGTYEITWFAEQLPSGVYFYRIQAGSFVETKKMVLMK